MRIIQFTDTHVSAPGILHFGRDSSQYLADAVAAVNALDRQPAFVIVTGDLVDFGIEGEYGVFRSVMDALNCPYYVIPGNHDQRETMRRLLPPQTYGEERGQRVRYVVEGDPVRLVALDTKRGRHWPGAELTRDDLAWLEETLAREPERPTIVAVHQPPFSSGLPYLDTFGFRGARALRAILATQPSVGRVIAGHIHHIVQAKWEHATMIAGPSTVPQSIPLLLAKGKIAGRLAVCAGFAAHDWDGAQARFETTFFERDHAGAYRAAPAATASRDARMPQTH
jgi:3',5'-cyclic AMP phosphodiesterase CpdA